MNILTAKVALVKIGSIEIEGLSLEDGRYAIAVQQSAVLFSVRQNNAQRDFKALLGAGFQFVKIRAKRAERQNRSENAILLEDFRELILCLVERANS